MDWSYKGDDPTDGKWRLQQAKITEKYGWLMFMRTRGPNADFIAIMQQGKKAWPLRSGRRQSMKPDRRERVTNLASQAIAYVTLMGGGEGFPLVDEI